MRVIRVITWALAMVLAGGMTAAVVQADGTDPQGKFQGLPGGGTPGVGDEFTLAAFGTSQGGCVFANGPDGMADDGTETCTFKNQSNTNWTWATITSSAAVPCLTEDGSSNIQVSTNLFENASCSNLDNGDAVMTFSGVNYNASATLLISGVNNTYLSCQALGGGPDCNVPAIQTPLVEDQDAADCSASGTYVPGVLVGCDFQIILGPSPDPGDWPLGTSFSVIAPEPSTAGLLLTGLVALPFAVRRRKSFSA